MTGGKQARAKGDRFERLTREALEGHGWLVVRAAGSLGPCDLVALRGDHQPWLVSCKATELPSMPPRERAVLFHAAITVSAVPVLAYKRGPGMGGIEFLALMHPEKKPRHTYSVIDHR